MDVTLFTGSPELQPYLRVEFGTDGGLRYSATIQLHPADLSTVLRDLVRRGAVETGLIACDAKRLMIAGDPENDDGEEIPVPTVAMAAFEKLKIEDAVVQ